MTDSARYNYGSNESDERKLPSVDFSAQILSGRPSLNADLPYRDPSRLYPEQGPPSTIQPNSNYDKFPDTSKAWWPTDSPNPQSRNWPVSKEDAPGGWGVHWADPPPVVLQWPPSGKPSGPAPDGPVLKPDPIQPPRIGDDDARKSVNINADARSIYLTGAATGAAVTTGTHFADIYTGAIEPNQRSGAAAFWRDNLSPSQRLVPERAAAMQTIEAKLPDLRTAANAAERTFDRQLRYRTQLSDGLTSQIPAGPLSESEMNWYNARVALVKDDAQFNAGNILANAGTQEQVDLRQRLFTTADATPMASQAGDYWRTSAQNDSAQTVLKGTEAERNGANQLLTQAERGSITNPTDAFLKGAGQGLLIATAAVATDAVLDKALGNSPELSNQAHWGLQGIGVPLLLLSEATPTTKVLGAIAMVGVSHTLDQYFGPPTGMFSALARPSLPQIGLATAGALVPLKNPWARAGLAATGWLAGKVWNYLDDQYEITGTSEPRLRDAASAAVDMDLKSPSIERFNFAVDEMRKFSDKNDGASAVLIKDWQSANNAATSIEKERGNSALMLGFGESLLSRGTRIDQNKWSETGNRLLAGLDYDLGGQATTYLRAASGNLQEALNLAKANKGSRLSSGTIDDAYISQLDYEKSHANQQLEKVYGPHDIRAVYNGIKDQVSSHENEMKTYGENLAQYAKTISDTEPRFKAKISRDLALIHTAFGEQDDTPGGKREHFNLALTYLTQAAHLDPAAPDQAAIGAIMSSSH